LEGIRRILVVDDAPMFRELESLFLARCGRVITASDGGEAIEIARRERPDVIVADLDMPGMPGDELCRRIKADADLSETPVIIVTGRDQGSEHARAVKAGADDVVEKPINRVSLIQSVNHFMRLAMRGLVRVPLDTDVDLTLPSADAQGRSINVSRGGIFIETEEGCPEPDTQLRLSFALPQASDRIAPTARVVWRRFETEGLLPGMGLQFLELDRESARQLDEYVYAHTAVQPDDAA